MPPRDRDLTAVGDEVDPRVADLDQPGDDVVELGLVALVEPDRLELAEPADERLQHAADGRGHHLERA